MAYFFRKQSSKVTRNIKFFWIQCDKLEFVKKNSSSNVNLK